MRLFFAFLVFSSPGTFATQSKVDSLLSRINKSGHDSSGVNIFIAVAQEYYKARDMDKAMQYAEQGLSLSKKIKYQEGIALCYDRIGILHWYEGYQDKALDYFLMEITTWEQLLKQRDTIHPSRATRYYATALGYAGSMYRDLSDYPNALAYGMKSLNAWNETGDKQGIARALGENVGNAYASISDYTKALDYYLKSIKAHEEINNKEGIADMLSKIGIIYFNLKDYPKALDYQTRSLKIWQELGKMRKIGAVLSEIGAVYESDARNNEALDYYFKSLKITEEEGDKNRMGIVLTDIGSVYIKSGDYQKGLKYLQESLKLNKSIESEYGVATSLLNISNAYFKMKQYKMAENYAQESDLKGKEMGALDTQAESQELLYKVLKASGNAAQSLAHYERYIILRDSLIDVKKQKEITRKEVEFQYEKKVAADSIQNAQSQKIKDAEIQAQQAELKQEQVKRYSLYGGLTLVIAFSGFLFNRFRVTRRQKKIIEIQKREVEKQKELVDVKNRNITDSITYAQRIQQSLLPSDESIRKVFPYPFFALYKPKDIVSGDFYWLSSVKQCEQTVYIVVAADCTGYGVPGAFLSMIGNMLLNEIVDEKKIITPSEILKEIHYGIYNVLHREGQYNESLDGMDIAVCAFDPVKKIVRYAGAMNPLYIVRENIMEVIKADLVSIGSSARNGYTPKEVFFTDHSVPMTDGMCIFMFSDGYIDQFNRRVKQRFGSPRFKKSITESAPLPINEQKEHLEKIMYEWMGDDKQIDDIMVIGIKI